MNDTVTFLINIRGNAQEGMVNLAGSAQQMTRNVSRLSSLVDDIGTKMFRFNEITRGIQSLSSSLQEIYQPGIELDTSLTDLAAITGETGEGLRKIEKYARETAKTFGGSAAQSVESYKLLLSQLTPELSKSPEALRNMGNSIATLSKTMGGDTVAAAEVLTTALNQYQVSMDDPIRASEEMARMMNVMAAAAMEGSAELPQIKLALENAGMAAKAAGVNFAETNAAIQVLDKAGKKGAEGGVALRNVMMILSRGRFLPPKVQQELEAAGVDIDILTDKSLSLTERLRPLQDIMGDTALITKIFGMANANAANALLSQLDEVDRLTGVIQGTNTAVDQANIVMDSYAERQSRIKAQFDDIKTSIFTATGDLGIWIQTVASALVPVSKLVPLLAGLTKGITVMATGLIRLVGRIDFSVLSIRRMRIQFQMMAIDIRKGEMANLGFTRNIIRATMAVGRFATVGLANAVRGIVQYVRSLVAGGAASVKFAALSKASFATFRTSAVTACKAVGLAIKSIPVLGWVAAATAAVMGLIKLFRRTKNSVDDISDSFRNAQDAANAYYSDERMNLDMMFAKLSQTNPQSAERNSLVRELKDMYPELNEQILDEIANTNDLSSAYNVLLSKIMQRAKMEAKQSLLKGYYADMEPVEEVIDEIVKDRVHSPAYAHLTSSQIREDVVDELENMQGGGVIIGDTQSYGFTSDVLDPWKQANQKVTKILDSIKLMDVSIPGNNTTNTVDIVPVVEQQAPSGIVMAAIDGTKDTAPVQQDYDAAADYNSTVSTAAQIRIPDYTPILSEIKAFVIRIADSVLRIKAPQQTTSNTTTINEGSVSSYLTTNDTRINDTDVNESTSYLNSNIINEGDTVSSITNNEGNTVENSATTGIALPKIRIPDYTPILSEIRAFVIRIADSVLRIKAPQQTTSNTTTINEGSVSSYMTTNDTRINDTDVNESTSYLNSNIINEGDTVSSITNNEGDTVENNATTGIALPKIRIPDYTPILSEISTFVSRIVDSITSLLRIKAPQQTTNNTTTINEGSVSSYQTTNDNRVVDTDANESTSYLNNNIINEGDNVSSVTNNEGDTVENNTTTGIAFPKIRIPDYTPILSEIRTFAGKILLYVGKLSETWRVVDAVRDTQDISVIPVPGQYGSTNDSDSRRSVTNNVTNNVTVGSLIGSNTNMFNQAAATTAEDFMELLRQVLTEINGDYKLV